MTRPNVSLLQAAALCVPFLLLLAPSTLRAVSAVQAWVQRYSHPMNSDDQAHKVVTDANGDVIVAGYTIDRTTETVPTFARVGGPDMLVIKYSSTGVALWTNRYNSTGNTNDVVTAVAVDSAHNVLITGSATIKYSSAGLPLWTNLVYSRDTTAIAVAADGDGNVFVSGYSWDPQPFGTGHYRYQTVRYSTSGEQLWVQRYDGTESSHDYARALAVDRDGSVFVTGDSDNGSFTPWNFATIKYSNAGVPLWTNRYTSPADGFARVSAMVVDSSGNVIVTGSSRSATQFDYVTLKYSGVGVPLWTNRYNGPATGWDYAVAVAANTNGDVYVAGYSQGTGTAYDFATLKYSSAGGPLWTNRYDGPGNQSDQAYAIAVDDRGDVLVTGFSLGVGSMNDFTTIKYSSSGLPLWTNRFNGPSNEDDSARSVAVSGNGNVYVAGCSFGSDNTSDFLSMAYSSAGAPLWTNRYNALWSKDDLAKAVAISPNGNVYVTGSSYGARGDSGASKLEYSTVAYSSLGVPLWTNRYNGPGNYNVAGAVAVDSLGNVYVTGNSAGGDTGPDYATIAYTGAGTPLWTNRFDGGSTLGGGYFDYDAAHAIAAGNGNVYVTGASQAEYYDWVTIAYSNLGMPLWTNRYGWTDSSTSSGTAVAVGSNGNVYVTGASYGGHFAFEDYATIAYSVLGVPLWTNRYDGGRGPDLPQAVVIGNNGNVYVTGASGDYPDFATIAYSSLGVPLWTVRHGISTGPDSARALAVDGGGNVYVTGTGFPGGAVTIKYSTEGSPMWTNVYSGGTGSAIALDGRGIVYVSDVSFDRTVGYDLATIAYSSLGMPLWTNRYDGPAHGPESPGSRFSLAIGPDGAVYVTGSSDGDPSDATIYDFVTIKYIVSPLIVAQPLSQTMPVGSTATFTVGTAGTQPFTYQWRLNGVPLVNGENISGATTATLTLSRVTTTTVGAYSVMVSNSVGSETSQPATLTVSGAARPVFISFGWLPEGAFHFSLAGQVGVTYGIDVSTNLMDWTTVTNLASPSGLIEFSDLTTTTFPVRFYRAIWSP
ncbi:MAG: SBBP repeat-containing protein [Verrucomicrobiales bacterium]|nr:SBBP repeat-containing protein [Verrucomicrobiales bacterium]